MNYQLEKYYRKYLKEIRGVSDSTIAHYVDAINSISKILIKEGKISSSLFEITDINELMVIKEYLKNNINYIGKDKKGHNMYSVGFNHYYKFATGEGFENTTKDISVMDEIMPVSKRIYHSSSGWKKSSIIRIQTLEAANYCCEVNNNHTTFTSKATLRQYMEGHHIIPMKLQDKFNVSLDIYANLVSLCPICHRLLHYGTNNERIVVLKELYNKRLDRFAKSGILLNENEFEKLVL